MGKAAKLAQQHRDAARLFERHGRYQRAAKCWELARHWQRIADAVGGNG